MCSKKRSRPNHRGYEKKSKRYKQEDEAIEIIDIDKLNTPSKGKSRKKLSHNHHGSSKKHQKVISKNDHNRNESSLSTSIKSSILKKKQRALNAA